MGGQIENVPSSQLVLLYGASLEEDTCEFRILGPFCIQSWNRGTKQAPASGPGLLVPAPFLPTVWLPKPAQPSRGHLMGPEEDRGRWYKQAWGYVGKSQGSQVAGSWLRWGRVPPGCT